ncbi:hypothetical protein C7212DRAFT_365054 [Tuber magnatum]|uniref:Uncharacterized protein n=1 Tax=Tuber magnatum TaxID=42249 RepID=A0A317SMG8_9PEZI|nr:hypothetical protein C7212DRAFT_365054 [Tuber magnatum]
MPEIPIFLMPNVVNDPARSKEILRNVPCNDQESVIARELKVIPSSEPSTPSRLWFDIQASRGLESNEGGQTNFTGTANGARPKKLPPVTRCNPLQTRIKSPLDIDSQPHSSRPESPGLENFSDLQFPDCEITDGDKDHVKGSAWGARIGSVLAIPMGRIGSRGKSVDSRKSAKSGIDSLERERSTSKAQPDPYSDGHNISMGGARSPSPAPMSPEETLHGGHPSPRGEAHYPAFQSTRDGRFGSSVGSPHQSPPAQGRSRVRQTFSKYSGKIATRGASPGTDSDHQSQPFASGKFSLSDLPGKSKSRVNRFLRPEQRNDTEDTVPHTVLHDGGSDVSPGASHVAILGASTNSEQSPPAKPGFRSNLTKRVNHARKRMSLPFIFGPDVATFYPPVETLGPRAVPPGPPRRIEIAPRDLPGNFSLPSEAKCVTVSATPPYLENNHVTQEWTLQNFTDMNIAQSSPPLGLLGYGHSPPQPSPPETNNLVKNPTPPHTLPVAPKINVMAPFESREYIPEVEAGGDIPKVSGVPWGIITHHENSYQEDPKDRLKPGTDSNEPDAPAALRGISAVPGHKPIELLEEEERRHRRDSRVMGLNPETILGDDRPASQADDDGRRDTYGAAIREIAGLDLTLRGPPALHSNSLGNVSGPSNVNKFSSPTLQSASNGEPAATPPATTPSDSPESETIAVTGSRPCSPFPGPGVTSASNALTTQLTIAPLPTTVPATSQSQHLSMSQRISSSFIVEDLSSGVYVKAAPQQMVTPVAASLNTGVSSCPETPLLGNGMGCSGGSPVSVSINGNGEVNVSPHHLDGQAEEEEGGEEDEQG